MIGNKGNPIGFVKTRNSEVLSSFVGYCCEHPDMRFWQALLVWSGLPYILAASGPKNPEHTEDTFYWEGRNS